MNGFKKAKRWKTKNGVQQLKEEKKKRIAIQKREKLWSAPIFAFVEGKPLERIQKYRACRKIDPVLLEEVLLEKAKSIFSLTPEQCMKQRENPTS